MKPSPVLPLESSRSSPTTLKFYSWEDDEYADLEQEEEEEKEIEIIQMTTYGRDESFRDNEEGEEEGQFEFAIVDREVVTSPISADDIFYNSWIMPLYPLFNTE
ncbi:hypothetical protein LINPERHAP2_LOCUS42447 [Linum perenne]